MSAIATVLVGMGFKVTGSDAADSRSLQRLKGIGVDARVGNYPDGASAADVVVRSTAVPNSDADVEAARRSGAQLWSRADLLSAICSTKRTIAVSGTHGKTTTSAMIAVTLDRLGWHPSWIVGSEIAGLGSGGRWDPQGEWLVVEADESDGTFTRLEAGAVVVTNVEADHLEYFGGLEALEREFTRFVSSCSGPAVICADDPGALRVASGALRVAAGAPASTATLPGAVLGPRSPRDMSPPVLTYGKSPGSAFLIDELRMHGDGSDFRIRFASRHMPGAAGAARESGASDGSIAHRGVAVHLQVPGMHNVRNAAAAVGVTAAIGAPLDLLGEAVGGFRGVARRFESRGGAGGVSFVDGYDHLPSEVAAAIATAKLGAWSRVVAVFQPHRYSRTEALWRDFADSFVGADVVVIAGIYGAGEPPRPGVDEHLIVDAVRLAHPDTELYRGGTLPETAELLVNLLKPGDLCLTLGAGDITKMADMLRVALTAGGR